MGNYIHNLPKAPTFGLALPVIGLLKKKFLWPIDDRNHNKQTTLKDVTTILNSFPEDRFQQCHKHWKTLTH
jgi:hypothetical protein